MRPFGWVVSSSIVLGAVIAVSAQVSTTLESTIYIREEGTTLDDDKLLTVHIIDVGGGDGILIDTPSDKKILIDGGWSWGDRSRATQEYHAYLDEFLEDDLVDLVIISHPDYDHFAGLEAVIDTRIVRQVWYNGYDSDELSESWRTLYTKMTDSEELVLLSPLGDYLGLGSVVRFDDSRTYDQADDMILRVINSQRSLSETAYGSNRLMTEAQRRNSSSIVLKMEYGKTSFLLTGDTTGNLT